MSHIVPWRVGPDGVLRGERDAAHRDDRQDAELEVLQSQDVVTALPKPGARTQTHTRVDANINRSQQGRCSYLFNFSKHSRVSGGHYEAGAVGRNGFGAVFVSFLVLLLFLLLTLLLVSVGVLVH